MSLSLTKSAPQLRDGFFNLKTPRDVAALLEVKYKILVYHIYKVPESKRYISFSIPKKSGGSRLISSPITALSILQSKLNQVLQTVYRPKNCVHGFCIKKSIVTNAGIHAGQKFVLNVDLKNFFPAINFGRVRGMFMAVPYNLNSSVATVLAQICCFNDTLPQGASTSPTISNMICAKLDSELKRLAANHSCKYSRYADDLTFSTSKASFPRDLGLQVPSVQGPVLRIGGRLNNIIVNNGFAVNAGKVRLQTREGRQEVTGLTTNKFPNVQRRYVRQIRAMLHAWERYGLSLAESEYITKHKWKHRGPKRKIDPDFKAVVRGKIEFIGGVRGKTNAIYLKFLAKYNTLTAPSVT